ncbi:hypothetical protein FACS189499_04130 [Clostridia bacterium]|nr:hypothetical protein FACS189499_04130 [Clostridia bacterium]
MQEQLNEKTLALSVKGTKLTAHMLAKAMQSFLRQARASPRVKMGKQSVKSLTKQGASLSNIEITGDNIGAFKRVARKYNVDFALKRDDGEAPAKWVVFFKAKDADALTAAFAEYSKAIMKTKSKSKKPLLERLDKFKELSKTIAEPAKHRSKGDIEL